MEHNDYVYAFRQNEKGTQMPPIYVAQGDKLEQYIFDRYVTPYVDKLPEGGSLIDIGAGEGRYAEYFSYGMRSIIAVEPDGHRALKAQQRLHTIPGALCIHGTVEQIPPDTQQADLILNIHVLQHVHHLEREKILTSAAHLCRSGGLFILAFTKLTPKDYPWNFAWDDNGTAMYTPTPPKVFERISREHIEGVLPVQKLDIDAVQERLRELGFTVLLEKQYAPRFLNERHTGRGRFFMWLYRILPPPIFHDLVTLIGYPPLEDVVLVCRKR